MPDKPRSPTAERDERTWTIMVCEIHGHVAHYGERCCGAKRRKVTVRPADSPRPEEREAEDEIRVTLKRSDVELTLDQFALHAQDESRRLADALRAALSRGRWNDERDYYEADFSDHGSEDPNA